MLDFQCGFNRNAILNHEPRLYLPLKVLLSLLKRFSYLHFFNFFGPIHSWHCTVTLLDLQLSM